MALADRDSEKDKETSPAADTRPPDALRDGLFRGFHEHRARLAKAAEKKEDARDG